MKSRLSFWLLSMALIFHLVTAAGFKVDVNRPMSLSGSNNGGSTCIASRVPSPSTSSSNAAGAASGGSTGTSSSLFYDCHVRTLNVDFTTRGGIGGGGVGSGTSSGQLPTVVTAGVRESLQEDVERTRAIRIQCNDKLFFESFLTPNQTLFRLVNLRRVEIESCKIRRIPGLLMAQLPLLRTLSIQSKNSQWSASISLELDSAALVGLEQLESLDLSHNNIWSVPEHVLCPLRSLVTLNMSRNRLTELEELSAPDAPPPPPDNRSTACQLNKLEKVDLSHNSLRQVSRITAGWAQLTELRLDNNLIEQLEDSALTELRELRLVNFSSNRLVALPPSIFGNNGNLREIYLANNSLSALAPAVFSRLDQLVLLDLSRNTLTSQWIREKMFHGLIRLVILRLSFNHLSSLDASIFKDLISLQALHLDNNRIETVRPGAFQLLANLHVLDLSNNRLTTADPRLFSNLIVLQQLYLDHNKIRQLDENALKNCSALQDVGLAGNLFQEVPVALRGLGLLRSLDLGENRIFELSNSSFLGLSQLYGLRMVDNRLKELPSGFCGPLKKLRVLNLAQNRLESISPTALISCPELRALRLDSNALQELPGTLAPQLPSLLWLNVSENRLHSADYRQLPPSLEWLDLSHNALETFAPRRTSGMMMMMMTVGSNFPAYHLRVLDLSYNNLTRLDARMIPPSLETIRMNYNRLKSVAEDTFSRAPRLRRVEMVGNELEVLPLTAVKLPRNGGGSGASPNPSPPTSGTWSNLPFSSGGRLRSSIPEFYLGGNPFSCDCSMEWLTRVNQHHSGQFPRVVDLDAIACRIPNHHPPRVIPLNEASIENFLCPYRAQCGGNCHCCDFDACDCASRCPVNCSCFHDLSWSRNVVRCSRNLHSAVPEHIPMNATEVYLDGNDVGVLGSHTFIGKQSLRILFLNDSRIQLIRNKTFNGLRSLEVLRLEDNLLTALHGYEFADLGNLRELYLENNLLGFIAPDTFATLKFLRDLRLDGNLLISFSVWELSRNPGLSRFLLSGNPWNCACEFIAPLRSWFSAHSSPLVTDFAGAKCQLDSSTTGSGTGSSSSSGSNTNRGDWLVGGRQSDERTPLISTLCQASDLQRTENEIVSGNNHIAPLLAGSNLLPSPLDGLRAGGGEVGSGGELVWTLAVSAVATLMLILLVLLIFRREIYHGLNDRLNLLCCTTNSPCICSGKKSCRAAAATNAAAAAAATTLSRTRSDGDESEKLFDAYFLYSKRDEEVLLQKIAPELEQQHHHHPPHEESNGGGGGGGDPSNFFRLCLHYRDLCLSPSNPWNPEMVLSACDASKRVVLILSRTLLYTEWTNMDFRATLQAAISRHHGKFIVLLLPSLNQEVWESFTATCPLLAKAKLLSQSGSGGGGSRRLSSKKSPAGVPPARLEWTDENFWPKLKQLFPPPTVRISTLRRHNCMHNFQHHHHYYHHHHHHLHGQHQRNAIALPPIPPQQQQQQHHHQQQHQQQRPPQPDLAPLSRPPPTPTGMTVPPNPSANTTVVSHSKKPPPSYPLPNLPTKLPPPPGSSDPLVTNTSSSSTASTPQSPRPCTIEARNFHDDHFYSTLLHQPSHHHHLPPPPPPVGRDKAAETPIQTGILEQQELPDVATSHCAKTTDVKNPHPSVRRELPHSSSPSGSAESGGSGTSCRQLHDSFPHKTSVCGGCSSCRKKKLGMSPSRNVSGGRSSPTSDLVANSHCDGGGGGAGSTSIRTSDNVMLNNNSVSPKSAGRVCHGRDNGVNNLDSPAPFRFARRPSNHDKSSHQRQPNHQLFPDGRRRDDGDAPQLMAGPPNSSSSCCNSNSNGSVVIGNEIKPGSGNSAQHREHHPSHSHHHRHPPEEHEGDSDSPNSVTDGDCGDKTGSNHNSSSNGGGGGSGGPMYFV